MINWQSLIFNSLWIFGLSLLLAAVSYHYWDAAQSERSLRLQLSRPGFLVWFWMAILLISIGLLGISQQLWEMAFWAVLTIVSAVNIILTTRKKAL